jgi:FtsH-binding integral membrane protein
LAATGAVAYYASMSEQIMSLLFRRWTIIGLIIVEVGLVIFLSARITELNPNTAGVLFFSYAILNGLTLAPIFMVYTSKSVSSAFFSSAAMFGIAGFYGAASKRDLSGWRDFLLMGLFGLIAAGLINMFIGNGTAELVICVMGVIIFTGLTAYDFNKLKAMSANMGANDDIRSNMSVLGALALYLDFINIFLYLLRIFGKRR